MPAAELLRKRMCPAGCSPGRPAGLRLWDGTAGGGHSSLQRRTPADCPPPPPGAPGSLGRGPRERHQSLGGRSRAHKGLVRGGRPFCSTSRSGRRGQRSRVHRAQARAPRHTRPSPHPQPCRVGCGTEVANTPRALCPVITKQIPSEFLSPPRGSACCVFSDSGRECANSAREPAGTRNCSGVARDFAR